MVNMIKELEVSNFQFLNHLINIRRLKKHQTIIQLKMKLLILP